MKRRIHDAPLSFRKFPVKKTGFCGSIDVVDSRSTYVRRLADIAPGQRELAGGKAVNLARLIRAGLAVPEGFCITAGAYREYAEKCGVDAGSMPPPRIRELLAGGTVPAGIQHQVLTAYRELVGSCGGDIGVAVRSSAGSEDRAGSSFAGQHDTILNVRTQDALLAALKACWAGLWTDRAAAYRGQSGMDPRSVAMAVVVQAMVEPESSGVIFTCNPVSGDSGELLVNAAWGLGEGLVSGRITPDELVVDRKTLRTKRARIAAKKTMVVPDGSGVIETPVPSAMIKRPVLSDGKLTELARIALTVETLFGGAQDIEWAYRGGMFHLLQARPVTAARPPAPPDVVWGDSANRKLAASHLIFWSNWNTRENMPYPLKPMAWSFFNDILVPEISRVLWGVGPDSALSRSSHFIDLIDGRAYWNMSLLAGHPFAGRMIMPLLGRLDQEAHRTFADLAASGEFKPVRPDLPWYQLAGPLAKGLKAYAAFPWLASPRWIERKVAVFWKQAEEYCRLPLAALSVAEMFAQARRYGRIIAAFAFPLLVISSKSLLGLAVIARLVRRWPELRVDDLLAGIPGNKTTETALELYRLSLAPEPVKRVFASREAVTPGDVAGLERDLDGLAEGREYRVRVERFFALYGHRGMKDLDVGHPSWNEDRTYVYQMIRSYLKLGREDTDPLTRFEQARRKRLGLEAEIERRLSCSPADRAIPVRRWVFRWALRLVHDFFPWRENEKFYGIKVFPGSRRIIAETGRRWALAGLIADPGDIFFLTIPEVERQEQGRGPGGEAIRTLVAQRRPAWERQVDIPALFIVRSDGRPVIDAAPRAGQNRLFGIAASSGRATGIARIVREPAEAGRLLPGEILVAPYTEPGWAPLFLLARAVVMEVGGAVCHGAIVAREYGIPAVVGATGATAAIRDGDRIIVDGDAGSVEIIGADGAAPAGGERCNHPSSMGAETR